VIGMADPHRPSTTDDAFWELCEFILDRLDELGEGLGAREIIAAQRQLVAHAMVKTALLHGTVAVVVYDLLKTLAVPFADHPAFRDDWRV